MRVDEQLPDGRRHGLFLSVLLLLVLHRAHDEDEEEAVDQADPRQDDEGHRLAEELIKDAAEGRRHQAPEGDEGEGDAQGLRALLLLSVPGGARLGKLKKKEEVL